MEWKGTAVSRASQKSMTFLLGNSFKIAFK